MIAFLSANMAPIMFAGLVVFLLLGYPVAFSLAANGPVLRLASASDSAWCRNLCCRCCRRCRRVFGIMHNDTLLAMPFFTFMGLILERSGMAEDLLDTIGQLFGPMRGGLAYAVVFVGALLAATTGVVAASVISMGLISLPIMLRYGYDRRARRRRDRRVRHAGADHPAVAGADRPGRPARPLGRRHVQGRLHPRLGADRRCTPVYVLVGHDLQAAAACRRCRPRRAPSASRRRQRLPVARWRSSSSSRSPLPAYRR